MPLVTDEIKVFTGSVRKPNLPSCPKIMGFAIKFYDFLIKCQEKLGCVQFWLLIISLYAPSSSSFFCIRAAANNPDGIAISPIPTKAIKAVNILPPGVIGTASP